MLGIEPKDGADGALMLGAVAGALGVLPKLGGGADGGGEYDGIEVPPPYDGIDPPDSPPDGALGGGADGGGADGGGADGAGPAVCATTYMTVGTPTRIEPSIPNSLSALVFIEILMN